LLYGILVNNEKVVIVNATGLILEIVYIIFFFIYYQHKKKLFSQILLISIAFLIIYYYAFNTELDKYFIKDSIGYMGALAAIIMFGSPLATLVIKIFATIFYFKIL
jgi:hypothetical protein